MVYARIFRQCNFYALFNIPKNVDNGAKISKIPCGPEALLKFKKSSD